MARRCFTLPPLRMTKRPAFGATVRKDVHRGVDVVESSHSQDSPKLCPSGSDPPVLQDEVDVDEDHWDVNPSHYDGSTMHEIEARSGVAGWEAVRQRLLEAVTEAQGMPLNQLCMLCDSPASVRCKQCGPLSYYCLECFEQVHSSINFLHAAESWIVSGIIMLVQDLWGSKS